MTCTHLPRTMLLLLALAALWPADPVAIVVNSNLRPLIQDRLDLYFADLAAEGWSPILRNWDLTAPDQNEASELRAYLQGLAGLKGAVLIGDLPLIWYTNTSDFNGGTATFPFDLYFMDLTVTWHANNEGCIDGPSTSGINPGIWVSRIKASNMGGNGSEVTCVQRYFDKVHRFRTGELRLPDRGLLWAGHDWNYYLPSYTVGPAYGDCTRVTDLVPGVSTDRLDWVGRWRQGYETEFFMCHSNEGGHQTDGGWVYSGEIAANDPCRLFWNCWNCSSANYTAGSYVAGVRLFTPTFGLIAVGSTKTGSMLGSTAFYTQLNQGICHGESFRRWFASYYADVSWHRGEVLLGDGTLKLGRFHQAVSSPTPPTISAITAQNTHVNTPCTVAFTVADAETPAERLLVWAESANRSPVPSCNIAYGGSAGSRTITLTPQANAIGDSTITVTVWDGSNRVSTGFVLQVVNTAPDAVNDTAATEAGHAVTIAVLANDSDPDGQAISLVSVTDPPHGSAVVSSNNVVYTPDPGYTGGDSFTYTIRDTIGTTATATVSVTVGADVTPPRIQEVFSRSAPSLVTVVFDEPVAAGNGSGGAENLANYALDRGIGIIGASLAGDLRTVTLNVNPAMTYGTAYTLTMNRITDRSPLPNPIASNTRVPFTCVDYAPGVAYWAMEEPAWAGVVGEVRDRCAGGCHGQAQGNAATGPGRIGRAGVFTGGRVTIPDAPRLRLGGVHSIAFWVRIDAANTDWLRLVGKGESNARNYGLWRSAGGDVLYQIQTSSGWMGLQGGALAVGSGWHHLAGTCDGSTGILYCDGKEVARGPLSGLPVTSAAPVTLGYADFHQQSFTGGLDEVRLFDRALNAEEVASLMRDRTRLVTMTVIDSFLWGATAPTGVEVLDPASGFQIIRYPATENGVLVLVNDPDAGG